MRNPPQMKYCGLTLVLSNPSRFDSKKLLTGNCGDWIDQNCLQPTFSRHQCDIRTLDSLHTGFLKDTKCILFLGEPCLKVLNLADASIHAHRGSPRMFNGIASIVSYFPQDAMDVFGNYEAEHNIRTTNEDEEDEDTVKDRAKTQRVNYKFWLQQDIAKAIRLVKQFNGVIPKEPDCEASLYPPLHEVCHILETTKNETIYLDIETDLALQLSCIGFNFSSSRVVYVVPINRYNYILAYPNLERLFRALVIAMYNNEIVCHNSMFDLFVLAYKYHVPFGNKIYDTMLAHHRTHPEVEKSLAHCISLWTWLPYHKDEGTINPQTEGQEVSLWRYNAKDVWTTRLIRERIDANAKTIPGLVDSIKQVNEAIRPYILCSLLGIKFDDAMRQKIIANNDAMMTQYLRMCKILVGYDFNPNSPKQCARYFIEQLGYEVLKRSSASKAPSVDEGVLFKYRLKHTNPVIDIALRYRALRKETGSLNFKPFRPNENDISNVGEQMGLGQSNIPMLSPA